MFDNCEDKPAGLNFRGMIAGRLREEQDSAKKSRDSIKQMNGLERLGEPAFVPASTAPESVSSSCTVPSETL